MKCYIGPSSSTGDVRVLVTNFRCEVVNELSINKGLNNITVSNLTRRMYTVNFESGDAILGTKKLIKQ